MSESEPSFLPISSVAQRLGVSVETIRRWSKAGLLNEHRLDGGRRFYDADDVARVLAQKPITPRSAASHLGLSLEHLRVLEDAGIIKAAASIGQTRMYFQTALDAARDKITKFVRPAGSPPIAPTVQAPPALSERRISRFPLLLTNGIVAASLVLGLLVGLRLLPQPPAPPLSGGNTPSSPALSREGENKGMGSVSGKSRNLFGRPDHKEDADQSNPPATSYELPATNSRVAGITLTNNSASDVKVFHGRKELILDLDQNKTFIKIRDHSHDIFRVDYNKNIITHPGSKLVILGALQDERKNTGEISQVLSAQGLGRAPIWLDQKGLTAGNIKCDDCLNETHIEDIFVKNSGDTMTGTLRLEPSTNQTLLSLKGSSGQSSNLIEVKNSSDALLLQLTAGGDLQLGTGTFNNAGSNPDAYITGNLEVDGTIYGSVSGTISPSGFTSGSVIFANSSAALAQDNSNLFWDDTNNRLGVGTTGPDRAVDVLNATNPQLRLTYADGTTYADFQVESDGDLYINSSAGQFLRENTTDTNLLIGRNAGVNLPAGIVQNTALGYQALGTSSGTDSGQNTAIGYRALYSNTTGSRSVAVGSEALYSNTTGDRQVAIGDWALHNNTAGVRNNAIGNGAMAKNTTGSYNQALGRAVMDANTTGSNNVAIGHESLFYNTTGSSSSVVGFEAGKGVSGNSYSNNALFGYRAGYVLTTGSNNIFLGYGAGDNVSSGSNNLVIGYNIDAPSATGSNQLSLGNLIFGTNIDGTGTTISTGNIGIGTTSPAGLLHLAGNKSASVWGVAGIQYQGAAATFTDSSTAASGTAASAVFTSFGQPTLAATNTAVTTTDSATIYIANAPTAGTNQTLTNAYALWVDGGTTRLDGTLRLDGAITLTNDTAVTLSGGVDGINFDANTLSIDATNNRLGIGLTTPEDNVHIYDDTSAVLILEAQNTPWVTGITFQAGGSTARGTFTVYGTTGEVRIGAADSDFWPSLYSNGVEALRITTTGNVGIGDTSPAARFTVGSGDLFQVNSSGVIAATGSGTQTLTGTLSVSGNVSASSWTTSGIQYRGAAATFTDSSTAASGTAASAVFTSFGQPTLAATNTAVTTTDSATIYIANAPTAGTNQTLTNAYALWVDGGTTRLDGTLRLDGAITLTNDTAVTLSGGVDGINFDANTLSIDATNNRVGIGTAAPSANFHVEGATAPGIVLTSTGNANSFVLGLATGADNHFLGTVAGDISLRAANDKNLYLGVDNGTGNNTPTMTILESGNVGIGDTSPAARFTVGSGDLFQVNSSGVIAATGSGTQTLTGTLSVSGNVSASSWTTSGIQYRGAAATFTDSSTAASGTAASAVFTSFGQPTLAATNTAVTTTDSATIYIANAPTAGTNQTLTNAYALWVDGGTTRLDGTLRLDGAITLTNDTAVTLSGGVDGINFDANTLSIDATNNRVGIGTAAPGATLHVSGAVRTSTGSSYTGSLELGQADSVFEWTGTATNLRWKQWDTVDYFNAVEIQGTSLNVLLAQSEGNVGIGTTGPEARVQISGGGLCVGSNTNCNTDNNTEGTVYSASTSMTLYDTAENYPTRDFSVSAADIVSLDEDSDVFVRKAKKGDKRLLGVISEQPALLLGGFNGQQFVQEKQVAVGLAGRIPVKVITEGGPITIGDPLTISSTPGVAMKASGTDQVIGYALQAFNQPNPGAIQFFIKLEDNFIPASLATTTESLQDIIGPIPSSLDVTSKTDVIVDTTHGRLAASESRMNIQESRITALETALASNETTNASPSSLASSLNSKFDIFNSRHLTVSENLTVKGDAIVYGTLLADTIETATAFIIHGDATIWGKLLAKDDVEIEANAKISGTLTISQQQAGFVEIPAGGTEVRVTFTKSFESLPVVSITPRGLFTPIWGLVNDTTEGFTIMLTAPTPERLFFTWIAFPIIDTPTSQSENNQEVAEIRDKQVILEPTTTPTPTSEPTSSFTPTPSISPSPTLIIQSSLSRIPQ